MLRGKIIVEDGRPLGNAGDGAFLKREVSNAAHRRSAHRARMDDTDCRGRLAASTAYWSRVR
jgi:hypothetical protein